jgi:hypothetical protein
MRQFSLLGNGSKNTIMFEYEPGGSLPGFKCRFCHHKLIDTTLLCSIVINYLHLRFPAFAPRISCFEEPYRTLWDLLERLGSTAEKYLFPLLLFATLLVLEFIHSSFDNIVVRDSSSTWSNHNKTSIRQASNFPGLYCRTFCVLPH